MNSLRSVLREDYREPREWSRPWEPKGLICCCKGKSAPSSPISGIQIPCCPGIGLPTVIHVTFSNSGGCPAIDGQTFALTNNLEGHTSIWSNANSATTPPGGGWIGPQLPATIIYVNFKMSCDPILGHACTDITLVSFEKNTLGTTVGSQCGSGFSLGTDKCKWSLVSCSCSPFNLVYNHVQITPGIGVCNALTATITL